MRANGGPSRPFGQSFPRLVALEQLLHEGELLLELAQPDVGVGERLTCALELGNLPAPGHPRERGRSDSRHAG